MKFKYYLQIYLIILIVGAYESWALNLFPSRSILIFAQTKGFFSPTLVINAEPGRALSLWLGYLGFGLMVLMNVYSLRKRFSFMSGKGRLSKWLDFHVFCGLVGPALILFHCNFKVRGLVGISFWSMVVSFSSGIIGRYFYLQLTGKRAEFEDLSDKYKDKLYQVLNKAKVDASDKEVGPVLAKALEHLGLPSNTEDMGLWSIFFQSFMSDIKLAFGEIKVRPNWPSVSRRIVKSYALNARRAAYLGPFQRLMGYWHAFHFPFAVFMYLAAVIHIAAALVFGTGK
jgi:hypothetical protein